MRLADIGGLLTDLAAESRDLEELVADADWATPTPAPGWTIAHQIAHLAWTDAKALIAVRTPNEFGAEVKRALAEGDRYVDKGAAEGAMKPRAQLLDDWRAGRAALAAALVAAPPGEKFPWYGPPMGAVTLATARLMETWAHAQDVFDALGAEHPTGRIRHVAWLGVRTRDFAFSLNGITPPPEPFRVELVAPDGEVWAWGPQDAVQRVTGSALDFCFVVTQRRNLADTDLVATGADAQKWLGIAQAFAGVPGQGRAAEKPS